jgi:hypothetical protein
MEIFDFILKQFLPDRSKYISHSFGCIMRHTWFSRCLDNKSIEKKIFDLAKKKLTCDTHKLLPNRDLSNCAVLRFHPRNVRNLGSVVSFVDD